MGTYENLKYAAVEIISNEENSNSIIRGLLRGITTEIGDEFIWTNGANGVAKAHNLKYFSIIMVTVFDGKSKVYTLFENSVVEQAQAKKLIKDIMEKSSHLSSEGQLLLDTSKFEDVPNELAELNDTKIMQNYTNSCNKQCDKKNETKIINYYNMNAEPFFFKRKTKKPTKKALENLRNKLDMIINNEYKYKPPAVKNEFEKETHVVKAEHTVIESNMYLYD